MLESKLPAAALARWLIQTQLFGSLSSLSVKHVGYPYGSMLPFILDLKGQPVALISDLAQHSKNLKQNPACALTVFAPGTAEKLQSQMRLTLLAQAEWLNDSTALASRYARYFPEAPDPRLFRDFHCVRFKPIQIHFIGGFGQIHWEKGDALLQASCFDLQQEQAFCEDLNTDTDPFLQACWIQLKGKHTEHKVYLLGIDSEGGDLRSGTERCRFYFQHPIQDLRQAYEHLKQAVIQSWSPDQTK